MKSLKSISEIQPSLMRPRRRSVVGRQTPRLCPALLSSLSDTLQVSLPPSVLCMGLRWPLRPVETMTPHRLFPSGVRVARQKGPSQIFLYVG